jgi:hypothetical protein
MPRACEFATLRDGPGVSVNPMKILFQTLVIFFGTLFAAGLVALGAPAHAELELASATTQVAQATPR